MKQEIFAGDDRHPRSRRGALAGITWCLVSIASIVGCSSTGTATPPGTTASTTASATPSSVSSTDPTLPPNAVGSVPGPTAPPAGPASTTAPSSTAPPAPPAPPSPEQQRVIAVETAKGETNAFASCVADTVAKTFDGPNLAYALAVLGADPPASAPTGVSISPDRIYDIRDQCRSVDTTTVPVSSPEPAG